LSNPTDVPGQLGPLINDPAAAEVYADNLAGVSVTHGNLTVTLATIRVDHAKVPNATHRQVTGRIVLPLPVAAELHSLLGQLLGELEAKGMITRQPPVPPRSLQ